MRIENSSTLKMGGGKDRIEEGNSNFFILIFVLGEIRRRDI